MKKHIILAVILGAALAANAADIGSVMKAAMKGDDSLYNKVAKGKGTPADAKKLAACLKGLEGTKAPKGDQAAYERKVKALVDAATIVANGSNSAAALMALQTAGNCKSCHSSHRKD